MAMQEVDSSERNTRWVLYLMGAATAGVGIYSLWRDFSDGSQLSIIAEIMALGIGLAIIVAARFQLNVAKYLSAIAPILRG